jgi:pimeloyl-ACP methyl ester carboxylesterase
MKYLTSPFTNWVLPPTQAHAFQELIQHEADLEQLATLLPLIQSKVTIIHGMKDTLVPVGNVNYLIDKLTVSAATHILPEESHFLVWTQYDLIRDLVLDSISTTTRE